MATVILEDSRLTQLLNRPDLVARFPALKRLREIRSGSTCGTCRSSNTSYVQAYQDVKRALAEMPVTDKETFRKLVGADRIAILYRRHDGRVVRVEF